MKELGLQYKYERADYERMARLWTKKLRSLNSNKLQMSRLFFSDELASVDLRERTISLRNRAEFHSFARRFSRVRT